MTDGASSARAVRGRDGAPAPLVVLFGAYWPPDDALATKPLVVELFRPPRWTLLVRNPVVTSASVSAEALAERAPATARVALDFPVVECHVTFASDAGALREIVVRAQLDRLIVRALTELSGSLFDSEGTVLGDVRLRLSWRCPGSR